VDEDLSTVGAHATDGPVSSSDQLQLIVMEQRAFARISLQGKRSLSIGRASDCDVVLQDPSVSRWHAVLHVSPELELQDSGSRNGSKVRDTMLARNECLRVRLGEPIQLGAVTLVVQRNPRARDVPASASPQGFVLNDPAMVAAYQLVERFAPGMICVLIHGETGVGKEMIAEAIHRCSGERARGPLVRINCATLSESLFESELFGHERGAFTGALKSKPGLLEVANGGTAFLDEVGELSLPAQAKLLRVLETREVTRVGGVKPQGLDVRFVAATNRDLKLEAAQGRFREDLYFRLAAGVISIPPLRERESELFPLVEQFMANVAQQLGQTKPGLSRAAAKALAAHLWPGNVRELKNVIECAVLRANGCDIDVDALPRDLGRSWSDRHFPTRSMTPAEGTLAAVSPPPPDVAASPLGPAQLAERAKIVAALEACHGNQTRAAGQINMPRRTLVRKLGIYGIPRPRGIDPTLEVAPESDECAR